MTCLSGQTTPALQKRVDKTKLATVTAHDVSQERAHRHDPECDAGQRPSQCPGPPAGPEPRQSTSSNRDQPSCSARNMCFIYIGLPAMVNPARREPFSMNVLGAPLTDVNDGRGPAQSKTMPAVLANQSPRTRRQPSRRTEGTNTTGESPSSRCTPTAAAKKPDNGGHDNMEDGP